MNEKIFELSNEDFQRLEEETEIFMNEMHRRDYLIKLGDAMDLVFDNDLNWEKAARAFCSEGDWHDEALTAAQRNI